MLLNSLNQMRKSDKNARLAENFIALSHSIINLIHSIIKEHECWVLFII